MFFFVFKQKTAYEMRINDWSSDVCSSDLGQSRTGQWRLAHPRRDDRDLSRRREAGRDVLPRDADADHPARFQLGRAPVSGRCPPPSPPRRRGPVEERKSVVEGKRVLGRGYLGGRRISKYKTQN